MSTGADLVIMQRVPQDFAQQHQADQQLADKNREGYTLLLAMRSWEFEAFTKLRRSRARVGLCVNAINLIADCVDISGALDRFNSVRRLSAVACATG